MAESLYRRTYKDSNIISILQSRSGLLKKPQTTNGQSSQVRNPCFVTITGTNNSCDAKDPKRLTLPRNQETWDTTYKPNLKPSPDLVSVTLEYGGDWGLARKISAEIRCYSIYDFEQIQRHFLLPGNDVDVTFGYKSTWGVEQGSTTLTGFKIATFAFNTSQEGFWICTFTGVSASTALKNLDMQIIVCNGCSAINGNGQNGTSGPLVFYTGKEEKRHPVKGVAQLIASDAQKNGQFGIDDQFDGDVISDFVDYNPGVDDKSAAIVVFTGDHLRGTGAKIEAWIGGLFKGTRFGSDEVETSNNQVFLSLGYIINRIINDQLLRSLTCAIAHEREKFNKLKITFHPEYSKSKVADGITSGDPVNILLIGNADYLNNSGQGKNFDKDVQQFGKVECYKQGNVRLQNILVHREVVIAAFNEATQKREAESDRTDVKDTDDQVVNVINFFEKIADQISASTGGAINLRLVEHPTESDILIVVDQNYGVVDALDVILFDPINGDGSTRTCEVASNVGSQEYKAAMFVGSSKKGDAISAIRGCGKKLDDQREKEFEKAKLDKFNIIKDPGNLGENNFNGQEINALKSAMQRLYHNNPLTITNETVHYPGLSMNIEIDGVWGMIPGNAISSTQIPKQWRDEYKSYFMVVRVSHTFSQADWTTKIDSILGYYPRLNFIGL